MTVRLVLADDHEVFRQGLCALLEQRQGYEVVGQTANGLDCVELVKKLRPDTVVMDVTMPGRNGIQATRSIKQEFAGTRIVALSIHADKRFVDEMLAAGADAYVPKTSAFDELVQAIEAVMDGATYVSPRLSGQLADDEAPPEPPRGEGGVPVRKPREHRVLPGRPGRGRLSRPKATPKSDRRRHRRAAICLPVKVLDTDRSVMEPGVTANVSPGGLLLELADQNGLREGQSVEVVFGPPSAAGAWRRGFVGRVRRAEPGQSARYAVELEDAPAFLQAPELLGRSPEMLRLKGQLPHLARSDLNVLVQGESGTGKNVAAEVIHRCSGRSEQPLLRINCPAIPDALFESQLFGHKKGAFTDAKVAAPGLFRIANHGTIVLDEISAVPPGLQAKLLQAIEEKCFIPVGGCQTVEVDVRVVALTNDDLEKRIQEGSFRKDLFYRLAESMVIVPPLRQRPDDIHLLADYFLRTYSAEFGRPYRPFDREELRELRRYPWPGNVRELENTVKRGVVMGRFMEPGGVLIGCRPNSSPARSPGADTEAPQDGSLEEARARADRDTILRALAACDNCKTKAAAMLGISYRHLLRMIKELGLTV